MAQHWVHLSFFLRAAFECVDAGEEALGSRLFSPSRPFPFAEEAGDSPGPLLSRHLFGGCVTTDALRSAPLVSRVITVSLWACRTVPVLVSVLFTLEVKLSLCVLDVKLSPLNDLKCSWCCCLIIYFRCKIKIK
jgi:hypothetical protein